MFVNNSMSKSVKTIGKETLVPEAQKIMKENRFRHLPVVDEDDILMGIVTDRDIRSAMPSAATGVSNAEEIKAFADLPVKEIMTTDPITVSPQYTIQDALLLIQRSNVGALPVVDENKKLKGIISVRDLLRAFVNVLGIDEPGFLIGIVVEQKVGQMKKIVDAITEENISFGSILVARFWEEGKRAVFPYLLTNRVGPVKKKLAALGFQLLDPMQWYLDQLPKND